MAKKQGGGKLLPTNRSGDFLLRIDWRIHGPARRPIYDFA
jgi:hypothetical protein